MSFVWKRPEGRLRSPEQVAREVLEVTRERKLDDFAAVLALMCIAQESDFWCPWNRKDPSSKNYPHDSESDDGRSVAYLQQQNGRAGEVLPAGDRDNWWGPMASRMDLKRSVDVFLDRLTDDYMEAVNDPYRAAVFIDNVQRSYWDGDAKHPGYYGKHWDRAWALMRHAAGPVPPAPLPAPGAPKPPYTEIEMFGYGSGTRSQRPRNFFLHTQEGSWEASAKDLAAFCQGQNGVSYHYTLRNSILYAVVDTDRYSWSVLDANVFSINLCFAGSSVYQTRQQWLDRYGRDIEIAAWIAVQDARKYGMSVEVIAPPYGGARGGVSDHKYVTEVLRIGTHSDVGPNFPWDVFKHHVDRFATNTAGDEDEMAGWDQVKVDRAMLLLENIAGIYRESSSPFRRLGEGKIDTSVGFAKRADGLGHAVFTYFAALTGDEEHIELLKEVASALGDEANYPDRQHDAKLAQAFLDYLGALPSVPQE